MIQQKAILIVSMILLSIIFLAGCASKSKFEPSTSGSKFQPSSCGFDNKKDSVSKIHCSNFWITSRWIELSLSASCTAIKASDCHSISFTKLEVTGTCNEEISNIDGPIKICTTGLTSGQQVDLNLELSYLEEGAPKTIKGKLKGKVD